MRQKYTAQQNKHRIIGFGGYLSNWAEPWGDVQHGTHDDIDVEVIDVMRQRFRYMAQMIRSSRQAKA